MKMEEYNMNLTIKMIKKMVKLFHTMKMELKNVKDFMQTANQMENVSNFLKNEKLKLNQILKMIYLMVIALYINKTALFKVKNIMKNIY